MFEVGCIIWGFLKIMVDFNVIDGWRFGFDVSVDGWLIVGIEFSIGLLVLIFGW